jgi:SAM-dependent methyltransferase
MEPSLYDAPAGMEDPRFVALAPDPELDRFVRETRGHGPLREETRRVLRRFVSDFDADGILGTHRMALLGPSHWASLLGSRRGGRLLDVGAGRGDVTVFARPLFREIVTTETSAPMARVLRRRGFVCHELDLAERPLDDRFDAVSLLNVLDRCDRPRSLLRHATASLIDGGRVLISVPLPVRAHVDRGSYTTDPDEPIGGDGETWSEMLSDLIARTITPLRVERIARAPYVSIGRTTDALDAALIVCARA